MKTSVILSTLAALCLIITFAESPTLQNTKNNNTTPADQFSYIHSNLMTANAEVKLTTIIGKRSAVRTAVKPNVDLSYLKFDVADYTPEMATEITDENSFEYLKFNVIDYTTTESDETPETPANEFEYLKFNVNDYSNSDTYSNETIE